MPVNKWEMVGPNLLVMPRGPQMTSVGLSVPNDTVKTQIYSSITIVAM